MLTIGIKKDVPVCIIISISIIMIFLLYITSIIKSIPCGKDIKSVFLSNFIHLDFYHLLSNLIALYALASIEQQIGLKRFLCLIIFILCFNTVIETIIHKIFPTIPCSVGLSGLLFGLTSWNYVKNKEISLNLLASISFVTIIPSLKSSKVSLIGHAVGSVSGIIAGLIWNKISPFKTATQIDPDYTTQV
tara:strand:+ start:774 stop:1343 length:570 start_codon:yes stop_codon:yes gene_type:complete